jgi:single-strand DNA-binding protein
MNNWNFTGNIGKDAETRFIQSGEAVVQFSVGVKSGYGDKATTTWARCTMWGKRGESVAQYLTKGSLVGISGEVTLREFTNKEGNKQTTLEVRVNDLTLMGGRKDGGSSPDNESHQSSALSRSRPQPASGGNAFDDLDSDIPF